MKPDSSGVIRKSAGGGGGGLSPQSTFFWPLLEDSRIAEIVITQGEKAD